MKESDTSGTGARQADGSLALSAELRGETMAYALQSGIYNLAANVFEPYIGYQTQKYLSSDPKHHQYGSYAQNLAGEFAGDIIGSSTLILAEAVCPQSLHSCMRTVRHWVDPVYTRVAHAVLADERGSPDYEHKLEQWKTFQERSFVRSMIIATSGMIGNIATQKAVLGNPSPAATIFKGKLLSTALTTALGLGARLTFPEQMENIDRRIAKTLFTPMMNNIGLQESHEQGHAARLTDARQLGSGCYFMR